MSGTRISADEAQWRARVHWDRLQKRMPEPCCRYLHRHRSRCRRAAIQREEIALPRHENPDPPTSRPIWMWERIVACIRGGLSGETATKMSSSGFWRARSEQGAALASGSRRGETSRRASSTLPVQRSVVRACLHPRIEAMGAGSEALPPLFRVSQITLSLFQTCSWVQWLAM